MGWRKRKCSVAYLAAILLLPLLSWTTATGGLPVCCWGMSCPMNSGCPAQDTTHCPMRPPSGSAPACCAKTHAQLTLPASLIPVVPMPPRARQAPAARRDGAAALAPVRARAGWPGSVFHPPTA